jgi:hypothetical protein
LLIFFKKPKNTRAIYNDKRWLRYQRVISLETQVGVTSQINRWANTAPRTCWRWDQVPRRSMHPLLTGHTRHEPSSMIMNAELSAVCQSQCAKYALTIGLKNVRQHIYIHHKSPTCPSVLTNGHQPSWSSLMCCWKDFQANYKKCLNA